MSYNEVTANSFPIKIIARNSTIQIHLKSETVRSLENGKC